MFFAENIKKLNSYITLSQNQALITTIGLTMISLLTVANPLEKRLFI